jgi:hypothetical protein
LIRTIAGGLLGIPMMGDSFFFPTLKMCTLPGTHVGSHKEMIIFEPVRRLNGECLGLPIGTLPESDFGLNKIK